MDVHVWIDLLPFTIYLLCEKVRPKNNKDAKFMNLLDQWEIL